MLDNLLVVILKQKAKAKPQRLPYGESVKKSVEVQIMGKKFIVRSDSDESYVQEVAQLVNTKIDEIVEKTKSSPSISVVILAAMNIADDHLKFRNKNGGSVASVKKKIEQMIELIDLHV
jgi:cell division protein ZapA (FtsZ GTPase activity inhibitor)